MSKKQCSRIALVPFVDGGQPSLRYGDWHDEPYRNYRDSFDPSRTNVRHPGSSGMPFFRETEDLVTVWWDQVKSSTD